MPKPFKKLNVSTSRVVLSRPKCAVIIAAIAAEWSHLEATLAYIYSGLVYGERQVRDEGDVLIKEAFESLLSMKMKRDFIMAAARHRFTEDVLAELRKALKRVQDAGERRNDVIHGHWGFSDEHPNELVWTKPLTAVDKQLLYNEKDFLEILIQIESAHGKLVHFWSNDIRPKLKALAESYIDAAIRLRQDPNYKP